MNACMFAVQRMKYKPSWAIDNNSYILLAFNKGARCCAKTSETANQGALCKGSEVVERAFWEKGYSCFFWSFLIYCNSVSYAVLDITGIALQGAQLRICTA